MGVRKPKLTKVTDAFCTGHPTQIQNQTYPSEDFGTKLKQQKWKMQTKKIK